jgi:hypothetical protein
MAFINRKAPRPPGTGQTVPMVPVRPSLRFMVVRLNQGIVEEEPGFSVFVFEARHGGETFSAKRS